MREFNKPDRKFKNTDEADNFFVTRNLCCLCDKEFQNIIDKVKD